MRPPPPMCPSCQAPMVLRKSIYGKFYGCSNFPTCREKHGAHQDTGQPLGIPGDAETRKARIRAHDAFDPLWKRQAEPKRARGALYAWLRELHGKEFHFGSATKDECDALVELLREAERTDALPDLGPRARKPVSEKSASRRRDRSKLDAYCETHPACELLGCSWPPCPDPHHLKPKGGAEPGSDEPSNLLRVCAPHHTEYHRGGGRRFLERHRDELTPEAQSKIEAALPADKRRNW